MKFFLDNVEENNNTLFCYLVIFDIDHISTLLTSKRKKSILYESNNTTNLFVWKITIISTYLPTTDFDLDNNSINDLIDIIPTFFIISQRLEKLSCKSKFVANKWLHQPKKKKKEGKKEYEFFLILLLYTKI